MAWLTSSAGVSEQGKGTAASMASAEKRMLVRKEQSFPSALAVSSPSGH
ncbi:hypothetical protein ACF1BQ_032385 [Bradyrhizobium sp. RDT10]